MRRLRKGEKCLLVVLLSLIGTLLLYGCAEQQRGACVDGYSLPVEDGWVRESEGSRTIYRKVTYARFVCTEWEEPTL